MGMGCNCSNRAHKLLQYLRFDVIDQIWNKSSDTNSGKIFKYENDRIRVILPMLVVSRKHFRSSLTALFIRLLWGK